MVGLSPAELESLNELIHIDHIYFKQQPREPEEETIVEAAQHCENTKELNVCEIPPVVKKEIDVYGDCSLQANAEETSNVAMMMPEDTLLPSMTDLNGVSDMMYSLSEDDLETPISLDFLDQIDLDCKDSFAQETDSKSLTLSLPKHNCSSLTDESPVLATPDMFQDIEHFLNFPVQDSYGPISPSTSDSGFFSDPASVYSPAGSEASLLEDLSWNDSLTDLFPDLDKI